MGLHSSPRLRETTSGEAATRGAVMLEDFALDWDRRVATCPQGCEGRNWSDEQNFGRTTMRIRFSTTHGQGVPVRAAPHTRRPPPAHPAATPRARNPRGDTGPRNGPADRRRRAAAAPPRARRPQARARHGPAPLSHRRHRRDASSAPRHRGRGQPRAPRRLGGGHPWDPNQALRVRPPHEQPRRPRERRSPAASVRWIFIVSFRSRGMADATAEQVEPSATAHLSLSTLRRLTWPAISSVWLVSCGVEVVGALGRGEGVDEAADGGPGAMAGSG